MAAASTHPAEMNDVSIATEATSIKTTLTQRRSRVNRNEHRDIGAQSEMDRKDQERAKHRDENETNKAKIETKTGSEEVVLCSEKHLHEGKAQGQVSTKASLC